MNNNYKRVAILGVDGAGAFFSETDTPRLDSFFKNGSVTYNALTSIPTISAECWGSMLLGVTPDKHRLTNSVIGALPYDTRSIYPSVFRVIRESLPDATLASFCNWNPINIGIVEDGLNVHKDTDGDDNVLTDKIVDWISHEPPTLLFVQFESVDCAGHRCGYGSQGHLEQITTVDGYLGRVFDAYESKGLLDDTLFIVSADHGGTPQCGHGGSTDAEKLIFIGFAGKTVLSSSPVEMEVRDIAAVTLHALGLSQPESWTARVPSGIFADIGGGERPKGIDPDLSLLRSSDALGRGALGNSLDLEKIITAFDFRNGLEPFAGYAHAVVRGTPTVKNGRAFVPGGGYICLERQKLGVDDFTISFFLRPSPLPEGKIVPLFSNKDISKPEGCGFCLYASGDSLCLSLGDGVKETLLTFPLPETDGGRAHFMLTITRSKNKAATVRFDFLLHGVFGLDKVFSSGVTIDALELCIGADGTGRVEPAEIEIEDFMLIKGDISSDELHGMKKYYGLE